MKQYETRQRKLLLTFLSAHADQSLSARAIADALAVQGVSLSAVYRNLAALEAEGKVARVSVGGSRTVRFRYLAAEGCRAHLHLSCARCGKTIHMDIPATQRLVEAVKSETDFSVDRTVTVLYGLCGSCGKGGGH